MSFRNSVAHLLAEQDQQVKAKGRAAAEGPQIVPRFSSDLELLTSIDAQPEPLKLLGTFLYDASQGVVQSTNLEVIFGPPQLSQVTTSNYLNSQGTCVVTMGVDRHTSSQPFEPWFSWVPYGQLVGTQPCYPSGNPPLCQVWQLLVDNGPGSSVNLTAFVLGNLVLQEQVVSIGFNSNFNRTSVDRTTFLFLNPTPINGSLAPSDFQAPGGPCLRSYDVPCGYTPLAPVLPMIRLHPANQTLALANQNTGDVSGDVAFICGVLLSGAPTVYQEVSMYRIQVNATYGCYAFCNYGVCLGGDPFLVGREALNGLGLPAAGQCTDNPYGTWFSLPDAGQCSPSQSVESGVCSWKLIETIKTISVQCLLSQDIKQACYKDRIVPFPTATEVLLRAFASDDPSQGGCPKDRKSVV